MGESKKCRPVYCLHFVYKNSTKLPACQAEIGGRSELLWEKDKKKFARDALQMEKTMLYYRVVIRAIL